MIVLAIFGYLVWVWYIVVSRHGRVGEPPILWHTGGKLVVFAFILSGVIALFSSVGFWAGLVFLFVGYISTGFVAAIFISLFSGGR